jgi:hypothetical protein
LQTRAHVAALILALATACGDDDGFPVDGTSGTEVAATFPGWVPAIHAGLESEDRQLIVDTGAPIVICDRNSFPALEKDGKHTVDLRGFGLTFPDYDVIAYDIFGDPPGAGPDGLMGGDLLRHFAMRLDYQGGKAALYFDEDPPLGDDALVIAGGASLPFELMGGGPALLPGSCAPDPNCGVIQLPATRIILPAHFEGQSTPQWVLLDTGASALATSESFLKSLPGNGSTRPRLDGVSITTAYGPALAAISRVWRFQLDGGDAPVALDDLSVLLLPDDSLLQAISDEVGRPIVALVGGSFLREFQTTVDYPSSRLVLEQYRARTHIPADEFIGVGFTLQGTSTGEWVVGDVYTGKDAATKGILTGEVVEAVNGTSITGLPRASVDMLFDGHAVGTTIPITVLENGSPVTKDILIEDLLPSYTAP